MRVCIPHNSTIAIDLDTRYQDLDIVSWLLRRPAKLKPNPHLIKLDRRVRWAAQH